MQFFYKEIQNVISRFFSFFVSIVLGKIFFNISILLSADEEQFH